MSTKVCHDQIFLIFMIESYHELEPKLNGTKQAKHKGIQGIMVKICNNFLFHHSYKNQYIPQHNEAFEMCGFTTEKVIDLVTH